MTQHHPQELQKQLDRTKTPVFLAKNSAFLASLMCRLRFSWRSDISTAQASGLSINWNPDFFMGLVPDTRITVLVHELWHPARLHGLRMGNRDPKIWNLACDIEINNGLESEGYSFEGIEWAWRNSAQQVQDLGLSWPVGAPAEQIYDDLYQQASSLSSRGSWGEPGGPGDMQSDEPETAASQQEVINAVLQAAAAVKMTDQAGSIPGEVEAFLEAFLKPVIAWEVLLQRFFQDLCNPDFDWSVRDRRYMDDDETYLPGEKEQNERLQHLAYIFDTSGSFTDEQLVRSNSEIKFLWDTYQPEKLTLVQFDTKIRNVVVLTEGHDFLGQNVVGRGGTSLVGVREWIQENKPTCAVIFTDLDCDPMEPLDVEIPIIWICVDNPDMTVPFGTLIHIEA